MNVVASPPSGVYYHGGVHWGDLLILALVALLVLAIVLIVRRVRKRSERGAQ